VCALARWIWAGEWREWWRAQARALISLNLSEPPSLFPCRLGFRDLFRGSRDEVPPHQDRLGKRRAADQQQSRARASAYTDLRSGGPQIVEISLIESSSFDLSVARQQ